MNAGHAWKRASDRATVCTSCGTVRLDGLRSGVTYYAPRPEVDQADLPVGRAPACEVGPLTVERLRRYEVCLVDVAPLDLVLEPVAAAPQLGLFGGAR